MECKDLDEYNNYVWSESTVVFAKFKRVAFYKVSRLRELRQKLLSFVRVADLNECPSRRWSFFKRI